MENSNTITPKRSTFLRVLRFVGTYALAIFAILMLAKQELFVDIKINLFISFLSIFVLFPLIWCLSKNFFWGFIRFAISLTIFLFVGQNFSKNENDDGSRNSLTENHVGRYSSNENGIMVEVVVGSDSWYGEVIEENTGRLISNESGRVADAVLYDQYNNEIGTVNKDRLSLSIQGQRVRLTKK
ncbi:MAG: hypothetical protein JNJ90_04300 [Saprospiraceae bacterium]|jgi:NADH:ubiquinone oxidoreductase subunit 5 (subunit L)/multisubunit Na+/H+ antiporter MnhA subunit|nr:hypothetical protein [Saprospiraceae bacterium]